MSRKKQQLSPYLKKNRERTVKRIVRSGIVNVRLQTRILKQRHVDKFMKERKMLLTGTFSCEENLDQYQNRNI